LGGHGLATKERANFWKFCFQDPDKSSPPMAIHQNKGRRYFAHTIIGIDDVEPGLTVEPTT